MNLLFSNPICLAALFLSGTGVLMALGLIFLALVGYVLLRKQAPKEDNEKMLTKTGMNSALGYVAALLIAIVVMSWTTVSQNPELSAAFEDAWNGVYDNEVEIVEIKKNNPPQHKMEPPKLLSEKIDITTKTEPAPDPNSSTSGTPDGKGKEPIASNGTGTIEKPVINVVETPTPRPSENIWLEIAEVMPMFCGCENKKMNKEDKKLCADKLMTSFLAKNTDYPHMARELGHEGKVFIRFIVEKDGSLSNIEMLKDLTPGSGLANAAVKAVKKMAKDGCWHAGEQRGQKTRVRIVIPVIFKLNP